MKNKALISALTAFVSAFFLFALPAFAQEGGEFSESFVYEGYDVIPESFDTEDGEDEPEDAITPEAFRDSEDRSVFGEYTYSGSYAYDALTIDEQLIYDDLLTAARAIDRSDNYSAELDANGYYYFKKAKLSAVVPSTTLMKSFVALRYDHPEFFWLGHRLRYNSSEGNLSCTYARFTAGSSDYADGSERLAAKEKVFAEVEGFLSKYEYYRNDYSKEIYILTYLAEKNVYTSSGVHAHDISGLFIDGKSVCEAYAKSFQLLCCAMGIKSSYVVGQGGSSGTLSEHGWDQIMLDGEWYNVDPTWADNGATIKTMWINLKDTDSVNGRTWLETHVCRSTEALGTEWHYGPFTCTADKYSYANHLKNYVYCTSEPAVSLPAGAVYYSSLDEAVSEAPAGSTLKLLKDQTLSTDVSKNLTIEGAGKKLTLSGKLNLSAALTVRNAQVISETGASLTLSESGSFTAGIGCTGTLASISGGSLTLKDNMTVGVSAKLGSLTVAEDVTLVVSSDKLEAGSASVGDGGKIKGGSSYVFDKLTLGSSEPALICPEGASAVVKADTLSGKGRFYFDGESCRLETKSAADITKLVFVIKDNFYDPVNEGDESKNEFIYKADTDYKLSVAFGGSSKQFTNEIKAAEYISSLTGSGECVVTYLKEGDWTVGSALLSAQGHSFTLSRENGNIVCGDVKFSGNVTVDAEKFECRGVFSAETGSLLLKCEASFAKAEGELSLVCEEDTCLSGASRLFALTLKNAAAVTAAESLNAELLELTDGILQTSGACKLEFGDIKASESCCVDLSSGGSLTVTGDVTLTEKRPLLIIPAEFRQGALVARAKKAGADKFRIESDTFMLYKEAELIRMSSAAIALTSDDGKTVGTYVTWAELLEAMEKGGRSEYKVGLIDDLVVDKLTLPSVKLTLAGGGHTFTVESSASLKLGAETVFGDVKLNFEKNAVINLNKHRLTLDGCTVSGVKTFKGTGEGSELCAVGTDLSAQINVFDLKLTDCTVNSGITVKGRFTPSGAFVKGKLKTAHLGSGSLLIPCGNIITLTEDITASEASVKLTVTDEDGKPLDLTGKATRTAAVKSVYGGVFTADGENGEGLVFVQSDKNVILCSPDSLITVKNAAGSFSAGYLTLEDAMDAIKKRDDAAGRYTVTLSSDISFGKNLPLPAKKKYASLELTAERPVKITLGSGIKLTAPLIVGENVTIENKSGAKIKAGKFDLTVNGSIPYISSLTSKAAVTLAKPAHASGAVKAASLVCAQLGLTEKGSLNCPDVTGKLCYSQSTAKNVKLSGGDITVELIGGLSPDRAPIAVLGSSELSAALTLEGAEERFTAVSGRYIYSVTEDEIIDVVGAGAERRFIELSDAAGYISSRRSAQSYTVTLHGDTGVSGKLPLPSKGTYSSLEITADKPVTLSVGGSIKLTGELTFGENVEIVCGGGVNAGKYTLNVKSGLKAAGAVKASRLSCGELTAEKSVSIAVFNGVIAYPLSLAGKIKLTTGGNIAIKLTEGTLSDDAVLASVKNDFVGSVKLLNADGSEREDYKAVVSENKIRAQRVGA